VQIRQIKIYLIASLFVGVPFVYASTLKDYTLPPKLFYWQLILFLVLGLWLFTKDIAFRLPKLALPALIYTATTLIGTITASHTEVALLEASKTVTGMICFLILSNHLTPLTIPLIITTCVWASIPIALLGIGDYFNHRPFAIPSAGLPSATLGFRNIAAMYAIQVLPWAFALFALVRNRIALWLNATALCLLATFLIYTRTRGAWAGLVIAIILVALFWYFSRSQEITLFETTKLKTLILPACVFIVLLSLPSNLTKQGPQSIDEKKTTIMQTLQSVAQQGGDRGRLTVWKNTLPMILDHPVLGVGTGNWSVHYPIYDKGMTVTFTAAPERPHNTFLAIWSETGSIGILSYLWFCMATIHLGIRQLKTPNKHAQWLALAGLVSFVAIIIHSLFSFPNERVTPTLLMWLVPAVFAALSRNNKTFSAKQSRGIIGLLSAIVILLLLLTWRLIQFESTLHKAVKAESTNNWASVASLTKEALHQGAFHQEALILHGYALNTTGKTQEALTHYQTAIKKRPYDLQLLNGLAIAAQNQQQYKLARQTYIQALQIVDVPDTRYNYAGLLLQTGHPNDAALQYEKVSAQENPSLDLYYHLALAYFLAKNHEQAHDTLNSAFKWMPENADTHFEWIEMLYRRHRNPALARAFYIAFTQLWPGSDQDRMRAQKRSRELTP